MKNISEKKKEGEERKKTRQQTIIKKKKKKSRRHARLPGEGEGGVNRAVDKEKRISYLGATNKRDNRKHDIEKKKTGSRDG